MKKINRSLTPCLLALLALAACTDANDPRSDGAEGHDAITLNVTTDTATDTAPAATRAITRADANEPYTPDANVDLHLYNGPVNATDTYQAVYNYNADGTGAWAPKAGTNPLYWDEAVTGTGSLYHFYAVVNLPPAPAGTDIYTVATNQDANANSYADADLMIAYDYANRRRPDAPLAFTLKHLMAQLTVTLTTDDDPATADDERFSSDEMADATAVATGLKPNYTLAYTAVSSTDDAAAAKAMPATATAHDAANATDFTMKRTVNRGTTDGDVTSVTFQLIAPAQALTHIVITIAGKTYTFDATQATPAGGSGTGIILQAGVNTLQPIMARKSGLNPGNVTVTPWKDESYNAGDVTADGVVSVTTALEGIDQAGVLHLYATAPAGSTGAGTTGKGIYPVSYTPGAGAAPGTATINTAPGSGYAPIIWEALAKYENTSNTLQTYIYTATFVPTDYRYTDGATLNHEKDYLSFTAKDIAWGTTPSFSNATGGAADPGNPNNIDQRLTHAAAHLIVSVSCADGTYTAAQLNAAVLTVKRNRKFAFDAADASLACVTIASNDATATATLAKSSDATDAAPPATATPATFGILLAPQTLAATQDDVYLTLTLHPDDPAKKKTYTLKAPTTSGFALQAGQRYTITASLKKSDLTVGSIQVTDWKDATGSGDFEW